MPFAIVNPVVNHSVRALCRAPYPNHPKGCPNYDKRYTCPPSVPVIGRVLDLSDDIYIIYNRFDFAGHVQRMKEKHFKWSQRQLECCLYWQGTARKQLRHEVGLFTEIHGFARQIIFCPEACGVDISATMKQVEVELEWPPREYTYQVALAGYAIGS